MKTLILKIISITFFIIASLLLIVAVANMVKLALN